MFRSGGTAVTAGTCDCFQIRAGASVLCPTLKTFATTSHPWRAWMPCALRARYGLQLVTRNSAEPYVYAGVLHGGALRQRRSDMGACDHAQSNIRGKMWGCPSAKKLSHDPVLTTHHTCTSPVGLALLILRPLLPPGDVMV